MEMMEVDDMETLRNWSAKRAGASITITHSTGKITGVEKIEPSSGDRVIATDGNGKQYVLALQA